jgi:DNA-binding transcriptional ArsR family regulator
MPIQGIEWLLLTVLFIFVVLFIYRFWKSRELDNAATRALIVIRSRGKASLDELVIYGNIPPRIVYRVIDKLLQHGLVDVVEKDGKILYVTGRDSMRTLDKELSEKRLSSLDKIEDTKTICPICGHTNKPDARFCSRCGTRLGDIQYA